jgi:C-terminal processing protease CtpA/Prc
MKAAFGLVSLLVVCAIVAYLWSNSAKQTIDASKPMREQAEKLSGRDSEGRPLQETMKLTPFAPNGKLQYIFVDKIDPDNPMAKEYGLKVDDSIVEVGPQSIRDPGMDGGMMKALILEARTRQWEIVVLRNGEKVTLKPDSGKATSGGGPSARDPLKVLNLPGRDK